MDTIAMTEQVSKNFQALLDYFRHLAFDRVTHLIEKQLLLMLGQSIPFFAHLHSQSIFPELIQLTINKNVIGSNRRIKNLKYLKYPLKEKINKYGRCNKPGQSILYAGFTQLTIFGELRPEAGDMVTISKWRLKDPNARLKFCPIFKNQPQERNTINPRTYEFNRQYEEKISKYPTYFREQMDHLVQFVADAFSKWVDNRNHLDYIFSAYFADKILYEFENGKLDAIWYPSVQGKLHDRISPLNPKF